LIHTQEKCKLITTKFQGLVCIISTEYLKRAEKVITFSMTLQLICIFLFFSGFVVADKTKEKKNINHSSPMSNHETPVLKSSFVAFFFLSSFPKEF